MKPRKIKRYWYQPPERKDPDHFNFSYFREIKVFPGFILSAEAIFWSASDGYWSVLHPGEFRSAWICLTIQLIAEKNATSAFFSTQTTLIYEESIVPHSWKWLKIMEVISKNKVIQNKSTVLPPNSNVVLDHFVHLSPTVVWSKNDVLIDRLSNEMSYVKLENRISNSRSRAVFS